MTDHTMARRAEPDRPISVVHAAADRSWGEWITSALQSMGLTASRRRIDQETDGHGADGSDLVVVSKCLPGPDLTDRFPGTGESEADGQVPVVVTVDRARPPRTWLPGFDQVSLDGINARTAYRRLASCYGISSVDGHHRPPSRFPGTAEAITYNMPEPASGVTGRDDLIDRVREHFAGRAPRPLTITGPAGSGKTLIALEYARRFQSCYDAIAFVQADSLEALRASLDAIANQTLPDFPANDARIASLADLQTSKPRARWLIICAGADHPSVLDRLIPGSTGGHVLVTSGGAVREESDSLIVPPLSAADARASVMELTPGIDPEDAATVADAMGGIPFAIRLASARIQVEARHLSDRDARAGTITAQAVAEFKSHFPAAPGAIADPVGFVVDLHLTELARHPLGPAAMLLLETCAFLGGSGLSWRLLRSPEMLAQLTAASPELSDPVLLSVLFHEISGRGLLLFDEFELVPGDYTQASLRVHPRVLAVIRNRLSPEQRTLRSRQVSLALAALPAPDIAEDVIGNRDIYAELLEHVAPSGAADHLDAPIRTWLANQVRYLWQAGSIESLQTAVELGEKLSKRWLAAKPPNGAPEDDPIRLRLHTQLGNVYRSLGYPRRAREIDEDTLTRQRRVLGLLHPRTLKTARSCGADLRMSGDFDDALFIDNATWQAAIRTLGPNHLVTITASGNLALSELLAGDLEQALLRRQRDLLWAARVEKQKPGEAAWILSDIGALQRELGEYGASEKSLREARAVFRADSSGDIPAPPSETVLLTDVGIAIASRQLGDPSPATSRQILENCQKTLGESSPVTSAALLSLAGDLAARARTLDASADDAEQAVRNAQLSLEQLRAFFGDGHPFTEINRVNLSCYALDNGQADLADELSARALSSLKSSLGRRHLWSVAAMAARANSLAEGGRLGDAALLEEEVLREYHRRLRPDHEFIRIVTDNHDLTIRRRDGSDSGADPIDESARRRYVELHIPPY